MRTPTRTQNGNTLGAASANAVANTICDAGGTAACRSACAVACSHRSALSGAISGVVLTRVFARITPSENGGPSLNLIGFLRLLQIRASLRLSSGSDCGNSSRTAFATSRTAGIRRSTQVAKGPATKVTSRWSAKPEGFGFAFASARHGNIVSASPLRCRTGTCYRLRLPAACAAPVLLSAARSAAPSSKPSRPPP